MHDPIEILSQIYDRFEVATIGFSLSCREGCEDCCTCNVTATSLEVEYMFSRLDKGQIDRVKSRLDGKSVSRQYRPKLTTNGFAEASLSGGPLEEEENDPSWGQCPLLEDGRCTIYHARPFGCRSMMSETTCQKTGYAQMPPLALTLSTIFLQYIEHLDANGVSGNFSDLVGLYLYHKMDHKTPLSLENIMDSDKKGLFIRNREIPALMVPPEHQKHLTSLVQGMNALMKAG